MASLLNQVVQLNNEGIALVSAGQDREGVRMLTTSLSLVQQLSAEWHTHFPASSSSTTTAAAAASSSVSSSTSTVVAEQDTATAATTTGDSTASNTDAVRVDGGDLHVPQDNNVDQTSEEEDEEEPSKLAALPYPTSLAQLQDPNYFIYTKVLQIIPSSIPDPNNLPIFSACIIFNLALAYHRRGTTAGHVSCMNKAENLYNMITRLLQTTMENDIAVFLGMIAVNNLSHIHYEQGRYEESKEGLGWLSSLIRQVGQAPNGLSTMLENSDLTMLLLNVLLINPPNVAAAA